MGFLIIFRGELLGGDMGVDIWFLLRCFVIGITAAAGLGPIFVLTFNRAATRGLLSGLATGLGGSIGDGIYFSLGLIGVLSILQGSPFLMLTLDILGGTLLLVLGIRAFKKINSLESVELESGPRHLKRLFFLFRSLLITLVNPLIILFFMVISVQVLPEGVESLSGYQVALSSFMVSLGSFSVLIAVSIIGSFLGARISSKKLRRISWFSGSIFVAAGIYLWAQFFIDIVAFYKV